MTFKIGFAADEPEKKPTAATYTIPQQAAVPRKSVVQVYLQRRHRVGCGRYASDCLHSRSSDGYPHGRAVGVTISHRRALKNARFCSIMESFMKTARQLSLFGKSMILFGEAR